MSFCDVMNGDLSDAMVGWFLFLFIGMWVVLFAAEFAIEFATDALEARAAKKSPAYKAGYDDYPNRVIYNQLSQSCTLSDVDASFYCKGWDAAERYHGGNSKQKAMKKECDRKTQILQQRLERERLK